MTSSTPSSRARVVQWLRKTHGWIGLWGAVLGLLFGFSGIWLNHRSVLPLKPAAERHESQLRVGQAPPADSQAMAAWLQQALGGLTAPTSVRVEPARPAPWSDSEAPDSTAVMQPEHWVFNFYTPQRLIQADYWVGSRRVNVRHTENGVIATMANLHKGVGLPVPWILLVDTLGGSLILLSLSGMALWMLTRRVRTVGIVVLGTALVLTSGLALMV